MKKKITYKGFELGPIRPPSEAESLMLRVTRNCPWNKCTFCGLYKGKKFSVRPVEHVLKDIDVIKYYFDEINKILSKHSGGNHQELIYLTAGKPDYERLAFQVAFSWMKNGMKSVFLQDANTLIIKPANLIHILSYLKEQFPQIERITSYARSKTIAGISDLNMKAIAEAGLNRVHIGLESASNEVLEFVQKGVDKETHIVAGQKVKRAGIELSEYYMPGLGGDKYSKANAVETADALNQINPDFIRIRTLAVPENIELYKDCQSGAFKKTGDVKIAKELLLFLENLNGVTSTVKSDHILNLFQEVDGTLPDDKAAITSPVKQFLEMKPEDQVLYMVGRRSGRFNKLEDMKNSELLKQVEISCLNNKIGIDNIDAFTSEMMKRFI